MPALENEKITEWGELNAFYEHHYRFGAGWSFYPKDKSFLGDRTNITCRFCGKTQPEVTFRKEAHALPQAIANKTLLTYYECDSCNLGFGPGCENDLGNWSLRMRTMARICGNNGIPAVNLGPEGASRIERHADGLSLNLTEPEGFYEDDPARNA